MLIHGFAYPLCPCTCTVSTDLKNKVFALASFAVLCFGTVKELNPVFSLSPLIDDRFGTDQIHSVCSNFRWSLIPDIWSLIFTWKCFQAVLNCVWNGCQNRGNFQPISISSWINKTRLKSSEATRYSFITIMYIFYQAATKIDIHLSFIAFNFVHVVLFNGHISPPPSHLTQGKKKKEA